VTSGDGLSRPRNEQLFDPGGRVVLPRKFKPPGLPVWTRSKAQLIGSYLRRFIMVTNHGNYIDGFAGPQYPDADEFAAKLVLEIQPKWLRHFYLFDIGDDQFDTLCKLRDAHPDRDIHLYQGDFNCKVDHILDQEILRPTEAAFCLLDQRTFECHWSTVRRLAEYKRDAKYKIELFYFFPNWWLDRALASIRDTSRLEAWWGRDDWANVEHLRRPERVRVMLQRFKEELGYRYVDPWPIYGFEDGRTRIMYHMIHASDHPKARELMRQAYQKAVVPRSSDQLRLRLTES
jgi:three-Cys-motif partner protein